MKSKQKMKGKSVHVYYLLLVVLLAVVALVVILNQRAVVVDEGGNIVGEAAARKYTARRPPLQNVQASLPLGSACNPDSTIARCGSGLVCGRGSGSYSGGYYCERINSNQHGADCVSDRECTASSPRCASEDGGDSGCRSLYNLYPYEVNCWCDSLASDGSRCEENNDCSNGICEASIVVVRGNGAMCDGLNPCTYSTGTSTISTGSCEPDNDENGGSHCRDTTQRTGPKRCGSSSTSSGSEGASCTTHADCSSANYCFQGAVCNPRKPDGRGSNCQTPDECVTPHCHFDPDGSPGFCGYP